MPSRSAPGALVRAAHPAPTAAVTLLAALLAAAAGARPATLASVTGAVLAGQLVIGWSNDLLDLGRDRASGRTDKPLASGELSVRTLRWALILAVLGAVLLSVALGWAAGLAHLVLVVGSGLAYNLGLKATVASWVPYAVAFGSLPQVAWLSVGSGGVVPDGAASGGMAAAAVAAAAAPWWTSAAGALLGIGAHLLNALPDLDEDQRHGIRGLPHRLGPRHTRALAPGLLLVGVLVAVLGPPGAVRARDVAVLVVAVALATLAWTTRGRWPFLLSMLMAVVAAGALVTR